MKGSKPKGCRRGFVTPRESFRSQKALQHQFLTLKQEESEDQDQGA